MTQAGAAHEPSTMTTITKLPPITLSVHHRLGGSPDVILMAHCEGYKATYPMTQEHARELCSALLRVLGFPKSIQVSCRNSGAKATHTTAS